jgi:hypothetical protein
LGPTDRAGLRHSLEMVAAVLREDSRTYAGVV